MTKLEEVSDIHYELKKNYEVETEKSKVLEDEVNKDKDIWTSLKSRLGSKKDEGESNGKKIRINSASHH